MTPQSDFRKSYWKKFYKKHRSNVRDIAPQFTSRVIMDMEPGPYPRQPRIMQMSQPMQTAPMPWYKKFYF